MTPTCASWLSYCSRVEDATCDEIYVYSYDESHTLYGCRIGLTLSTEAAELVYEGIVMTTLAFTTMVTPMITANTNANVANAMVAALKPAAQAPVRDGYPGSQL
jgi:hypothetical protein